MVRLEFFEDSDPKRLVVIFEPALDRAGNSILNTNGDLIIDCSMAVQLSRLAKLLRLAFEQDKLTKDEILYALDFRAVEAACLNRPAIDWICRIVAEASQAKADLTLWIEPHGPLDTVFSSLMATDQYRSSSPAN